MGSIKLMRNQQGKLSAMLTLTAPDFHPVEATPAEISTYERFTRLTYDNGGAIDVVGDDVSTSPGDWRTKSSFTRITFANGATLCVTEDVETLSTLIADARDVDRRQDEAA